MTEHHTFESLREYEDPELLRRSREGDRQAFGELWRRHRERALITAKTLAGSECEDVVAEAFTTIWTRLQDGRGPSGDFRPYLLATVRNLSAKSFKRSMRTVVGVSLEREAVEDGSLLLEDADSLRDIRVAFDELPERWQRVLWLSTVQERPRSEVASEMRLSANSTSQLLRRAKEGLRVAWLTQRIPGKEHFLHPEIVEDLPRFVREAAGARRQREIRDHLSQCANCRAACGELRREDAALGQMSSVLASAGIALPVAAGGVLAVGSTLGAPVPASAATGPAGAARFWPRGLWGKWVLGAALCVSLAAVIVGVVAGIASQGSSNDRGASPQGSSESTAPPVQSDEAGGDTDGLGETPPERGAGAQEPESQEAAGDRGASRESSFAGPTATEQRPQISMAFTDTPTGRTAPIVTGTAAPRGDVLVSVTGEQVEVLVQADGSWSVDLSSLELGVGTHSVVAQQKLATGTLSTRPLTFSLELPRASASLAGSGSSASGAAVTLTAAGQPNSDVCFSLPGNIRGSISLDASGRGSSVVRESVEVGSMLEFQYCKGQQRGATGRSFVQ